MLFNHRSMHNKWKKCYNVLQYKWVCGYEQVSCLIVAGLKVELYKYLHLFAVAGTCQHPDNSLPILSGGGCPSCNTLYISCIYVSQCSQIQASGIVSLFCWKSLKGIHLACWPFTSIFIIHMNNVLTKGDKAGTFFNSPLPPLGMSILNSVDFQYNPHPTSPPLNIWFLLDLISPTPF